MEYIIVVCSNEQVCDQIRKIVETNFPNDFILEFPQTEETVLELLNFQMPELVIMNFSDENLNLEYVKDQILQDSWLHNFGILGLYDRKVISEETLLKLNKTINVLTFLDYTRLDSHLAKTLHVIYSNRQLIFQDFLAGKLVQRMTGSFQIENSDYLVTPLYGGLLAISLVRMGRIPSQERYGVQMALSELIINGIEHGNCGISYEEKSQLLSSGKSIYEIIEERCQDSEIASKKVSLHWDFDEYRSHFIIRDEGEGFNVLKLRDILQKTSTDTLHGRGILMAQLVASKLLYNKKGNQVTLAIEFGNEVQSASPAGFSQEEIIKFKAGHVLMESGEFADCIYYITSGEFTVYHEDNPVGRITPADIFIGEMAFLLNNFRSAKVVADTSGQVIKIPRQAFIDVIKKYPQYLMFLAKTLAQKLVRTNEYIASENRDKTEGNKSANGVAINIPTLAAVPTPEQMKKQNSVNQEVLDLSDTMKDDEAEGKVVPPSPMDDSGIEIQEVDLEDFE